MAKNVSNRKPLAGNKRAHSCKATKHTQKVNLQVVTLDDGQKVRMSAKEIKTMNKCAA